MTTRTNRVADLIRDEVSKLLLRELRDPRIGFVTITGASVSPDLRNVRVYVSVLGKSSVRDESLQALNSAAGFVRRAIFKNLRLRYSPTVSFHLDESLDRGARIEEVLGWGVDRVIVGTALLDTPELVPEVARAHPGRLILGLDARDGVLAVRGWRQSAGLPVEELLDRFADLPLDGILHTDIGVDGLLKGPNVKATAALARRTQHPVIASGGVGTLEHLVELARVRVIAAVVVGRALYSGAIDLEQALATVARC